MQQTYSYTNQYRPSYQQNNYKSDNYYNSKKEEEQEKTKVNNRFCKEHEKEEIKVVCFTNDCQHKSRLLCIKCMMGPHHEHYDHFTLIEEIITNAETNPLQVKNWPKINRSEELKEFFQGVQQDIKVLNEFENNVDRFIQEVQTQLEKVKERTLDKMKTRKEKACESEKLLKESLNKNFPLLEASTFLKDFQENKFNEEELEKKIQEFLKKEKYETAEKEVLDLFEKQQDELSKVPQLLKHPDIVQDKMNQILILINSLYSQNLQFQKCINYQPNLDQEDSVKILDNQLQFKGAPMTSTYVFSDGFKINQKISLKIKISENDNRNHLYLGIGKRNDAEQGKIFEGGNYFDIQNKGQNSNKESSLKGEWIENYIDRVLQISIYVQENKFKIQDKNGSSVVENLYKFDISQENKDQEEWCVIIGTSYLHSFKVNLLQFIIEENNSSND